MSSAAKLLVLIHHDASVKRVSDKDTSLVVNIYAVGERKLVILLSYRSYRLKRAAALLVKTPQLIGQVADYIENVAAVYSYSTGVDKRGCLRVAFVIAEVYGDKLAASVVLDHPIIGGIGNVDKLRGHGNAVG